MNSTISHAPAQVSTRAALIAAASAALPISSLDMQALGSRTAWGQHTRPGRIKARSRALRVMVRAAERAMQERPDLHPQHICTALRSLAIQPSDLLVCTLSGAWITTPAAVKKRGEEVSRAILELALAARELEQMEEENHG